MEFDDDDLPGDANNNSGAAAASRRPNTSRGGDSSSGGMGSISTEAERPKTGYRTSQSRVGSAQGSSEGRPYSR